MQRGEARGEGAGEGEAPSATSCGSSAQRLELTAIPLPAQTCSHCPTLFHVTIKPVIIKPVANVPTPEKSTLPHTCPHLSYCGTCPHTHVHTPLTPVILKLVVQTTHTHIHTAPACPHLPAPNSWYMPPPPLTRSHFPTPVHTCRPRTCGTCPSWTRP